MKKCQTPKTGKQGMIATRLKTLGLAATLVAAQIVTQVPAALAQDAGSPFAPVLKVNDSVITQYELDQRMRFLMLLRIPGDPQETALRALVNDRLAAQEARRVGLRLTAEQVTEGMAEFAARANLSSEEFVAALVEGGVDAETFRDFVANGLLWRELVPSLFGATTSVTEAEIDRVIANGSFRSAMQFLLSEIAIPVQGDPEDELALARELRASITSEDGFASAARRHSASPSAGRGGRLDWIPSSSLPPQIVQVVLPLGPGQVSQPVVTPDAIILFQLRDVTEDQTAEAPALRVEYAQFLMPNTATVQAEAEALGNRIDSCKDLWAEARSLPEDRLTIEKKDLAEVPQDIALELAQLDPGEHSLALSRGGFRVFLMLCAREPKGEEGAEIDRTAISNQIQSLELEALAGAWQEELRSEAIIQEP